MRARPVRTAVSYSKHALQDCVKARGPEMHELQRQVAAVFRQTTPAESLPVLNARLLGV